MDGRLVALAVWAGLWGICIIAGLIEAIRAPRLLGPLDTYGGLAAIIVLLVGALAASAEAVFA